MGPAHRLSAVGENSRDYSVRTDAPLAEAGRRTLLPGNLICDLRFPRAQLRHRSPLGSGGGGGFDYCESTADGSIAVIESPGGKQLPDSGSRHR